MSTNDQHPTLLELAQRGTARVTDIQLGPEGIEMMIQDVPESKPYDPVNHPGHYTQYQGLEIIDLTEQMNFNKGNAVKYIARAGWKDPAKEVEDLEKAIWYTQREIDRIKNRP